MTKLLKQIHRVYTLFVILLFFIIFYPFYYYCSRNESRYSLLNRFRKIHSSLICFLTGITFHFDYEEKPKPDTTYIYCSNHTSNMDIMVFCMLAQGRFHFMGKDELLENPVLRLFFNTIDISVNRESKISAFKAFKKAGENLEKGMSLIIFPEGKIDEAYPPHLQSFKNGPFRLAIEKNIAIVPVSIIDLWKYMWDDGAKYGTKPGAAHIYVHKPIQTQELSAPDADIVKDLVFDKIQSKLLTAAYPQPLTE